MNEIDMREMGRRFMKNKRSKYHIVLALLLALVGLGLCLVEGSYAAYSNQGFRRGVVRNRDSEEIRFTSNILKPYVSTSEGQKNYETVLYPFAEDTNEDERLTIPLTIANYLMNNGNLVSESDITFDLTIQLENKQSGSSYTLDNEVITDSITKSNVALTGRKQNQVDYTIGFTGKDLDKLTIVIEAKPHNFGNKILAAYICPCTNSQVNPFSYSGSFLNKNVGEPQDYYGYNYEVSISSGRGKVTLSWDPQYVKLDPFFLENLKSRQDLKIDGTNAYIYDKEGGSIQFLMDQTLGEDDYVILFYPIQKMSNETTWEDMEQIIRVEVQEIDISP